jgi:hypothetical protein
MVHRNNEIGEARHGRFGLGMARLGKAWVPMARKGLLMATATDHEFEEFLRLVTAMRLSQDAYFHTRDRVVLKTCKVLERKVDSEIERLTKATPQPTLF